VNQLFCRVLFFCAGTMSAAVAHSAAVAQPAHVIPMTEKSAETFYIQGAIQGLGNVEFLVDTGSSYVTINEHTLAMLKQQGEASYVKDLTGILANGQRKRVSVYRIGTIQLGGKCELYNVEAAVFPGRTRHILGLSGLRKAGAFTFSFEPPQLMLAECAPAPSP